MSMIDIDEIPAPGKFGKPKPKAKPEPKDDELETEDDKDEDKETEAKSAAEDFCSAIGVSEDKADDVLEALKTLLPHLE